MSSPGTRGEIVYIPACVTHSAVDDLVYNDFYIGAGADVTIVAGCGVHSDGEEEAKHNGVHRFFLEKGARVLYLEKHIGTGGGAGARVINPVTDARAGRGRLSGDEHHPDRRRGLHAAQDHRRAGAKTPG